MRRPVRMALLGAGLLAAALGQPAAVAPEKHVILVYGQSTAGGNWGCPALSDSQPFDNQTFFSGPGGPWIPLIEKKPTNPCVGGSLWNSSADYPTGHLVVTATARYVSLRPGNVNNEPGSSPEWWQPVTTQESPLSAALNNATLLDPAHVFTRVGAVFSSSGASIAQLSRGTTPYNSIWGPNGQLRAYVRTGVPIVVDAVLFIQSESDWAAGSQTYEADLTRLQADAEADTQAITGQSAPVPFLIQQLGALEYASASSLQPCPDGTVACIDDPAGASPKRVPLAQLQAALHHPGKFYLTGPRYHLTTMDGGYHYDPRSYNLLGATAARLIWELLGKGNTAAAGAVIPEPESIVRVGQTVRVAFRTPLDLDLELDNATIPNPFRNGAYDTACYGFQFFQTVNGAVQEVACSRVSVSGKTATIVLAAVPTGSNHRLAYAFEGQRGAHTPQAGCSPDAGVCAGVRVNPSRGSVRGNLRTKEDFTSLNGDRVYHWAVAFNLPAATIVGPELRVSPGAFVERITSGGPAPAPRTITIASGTPVPLSAWTAARTQPWLALSAESGAGPGSIAASIKPSRLRPGTYTDIIKVTTPDAGSAEIRVTLEVRAPRPVPRKK